ncbi:MAG TPA: adenylate/guanylate cyclase domain-containing protein [Chitinophagaceae bacterium]|jgi:class 3 adenylate cyclase|nr:adenylate/guanylate cyclase domain-containing protein [Chitinophagaceae bacterium]
MPKLSLKNILGKNSESTAIVTSLMEQLQAKIRVEDESGKILLQSNPETDMVQYPIRLDDEILGWVKGDEKGAAIAALLHLLLQKEAERKKLGSEVLNLYQEVNMIFDFSEKLAQTIEANSISQVTLNEASRVIQSNNGVIVLWDEKANKLQVAASIGELFFDQEKINTELSLLQEIIFNGQSEIISDISRLKQAGVILSQVQSVIYSALKVKHRIMGAIILASNEPVQYTAADLKLLTTLALQSSAAIESALLYEKNMREAQEKEEAMRRIYEVTNKFVPFEFIKSLGHDVITDVKLGDQVEKIVTVLFSDIREYTTLSEKMTPEENFSFVCSFNERIGPIIRKHHGFVNQYLGDAIMAIFPGNAADALSAAIEMQQEVQRFNAIRQLQNEPTIQIGIGMHTGPLIMGITGDKNRMDACTISDTVNTASRLESLTKHYKAGILLSDASLRQVTNRDHFLIRNLGFVQLKGKQESINVHECFNGNPKTELQKKSETLSDFNAGVTYYLNKSFSQANKAFQKVLEYHPEDRTAKFFFTYTQQIIENGIADSKAGIVEMHEK